MEVLFKLTGSKVLICFQFTFVYIKKTKSLTEKNYVMENIAEGFQKNTE